ncbi:MAG: class II aldolase/adducin family protein [Actinobacteria bacterium]|nr:class II aldolase/adducin family protein [Actinomycetota bacterium]
MNELQLKYKNEIEEMTEVSIRLGEIGFATSHGGNLCYKVDNDIILITPTKVVKRKMRFEDIVIVNNNGDTIFSINDRKPSGDLVVFKRILQKRPDIKGIVHAHPPVLTGFACTDSDLLSRPYLPEVAIELGPVLNVSYKEPVTEILAKEFDNVIHKGNAFLMRNHGVTICNPESVARAMDMLEMLEAQASSVLTGCLLGNLKEIQDREVDNLEKTLRNRGLKLPGDPRFINSLGQLFRKDL